MDAKEGTAMMKLCDLLKTHKGIMKKCPEIIEIIEELYVDMEKQQIVDAYAKGSNDRLKNIVNDYYNETYGN